MSNFIIAIATVVIAFWAWKSYTLSKKIGESSEQQYKNIVELADEIRIAILIVASKGRPHAASHLIDEFKKILSKDSIIVSDNSKS